MENDDQAWARARVEEGDKGGGAALAALAMVALRRRFAPEMPNDGSETLRPAPLSLWRAAARVTAPSLVLFGQDDRLVHPRLAERAARTFRDARVRVLPRTGHLAQMERPGLVAALFRELAAEVRSRGADTGNSGSRDPVDAR